MKTFKEFIKEEGYDIARDMGKVPKTKDKKDATSYPPSEEMKKLRKVNKGPSALERVKSDIRKKYGKGAIMGESMSGGVPMTPQELNIQKKMSQLNVRLARKRSQQLQKAKVQDTETAPEQVKEEGLRDWFGKSKSKDGKGGWVNVVTGGTCASDEPGEGTPKCVSSAKRASMSKAERLSAARRKKKADPGQQSKSGAAKPTYVRTDSPRKKK